MKHIIDIIGLIDCALVNFQEEENVPAGSIICSGYNQEVDDLRNSVFSSKEWLGNYQRKLIDQTGISSLKIKYTSVGGYFIEIPKRYTSKIGDEFIHKQTLVNATRFMTQELQKFSDKLLFGEEQLLNKEKELFQELCSNVLKNYGSIKEISLKGGYIDFLGSLSKVGYNNNYCKPNISKNIEIGIKLGRHAVLESIENEFISNDLYLSNNDYIHIITGPNMGGKSTFLRQNALIILLSHMGSFVPALSAKIPLTDKIFSRVGASDNLYLGQSTFMVEMQEVSYILHNSTDKSFIIIDEVGRGTSTFDGMSLAWAILVYIHDVIKAKTLFATHYHELIDHSQSLEGVLNFSVAVGEQNETIIFLRKIIAGGVYKSYGLSVAKLAGVPEDVLCTAKEMLHVLEKTVDSPCQLSLDSHVQLQEKLPASEEVQCSELLKKISEIDINNMTPMEALLFLQSIK